jgi:2-polyprenyl-3-methyl-5-hydroxy-6-metoxy-1,4-benzoquinol methylase
MGAASTWRGIDSDPNSHANLLARRDTLARAQVVESRTREEIILDLCRGRNVLDIGCVDHEVRRISDDDWLHGQIVKVASHCLGVDNDPPGIEAMQQKGFNVVLADITGDLTVLEERAPFDVMVAGEIIEHLGRPEALLDAARRLLGPDGRLIITTPNPFAPWRAFGGMRRQVCENVDHVIMLFPAGMVELAERSGFRVTTAATVGGYRKFMTFPGAFRVLVGMWARALLRKPKGEGPLGISYPAGYVSPFVAFYIHRLARLGQLNETSLYILEPNEVPAGA